MLSVKATETIARITNPLEGLGINNFIHDITFERGQISILSNNPQIFKYYYQNQVPAVCTNEQGRILEAGIYLDCKLMKDYPDYSSTIPKISEQINFRNLLHVVETEHDCQHMYSFLFALEQVDFLHIIANKMNIIKKFIYNYKLQAKEILTQIKLPKNRITLPCVENSKDLLNNQKSLKILSNAPKLTNRQVECCQLLLSGKTAKEIARQLDLSPRTVEYYLTNIKLKLKCSNKVELVTKLTHFLK
jgi:DNA-binding CsgD family transcriptional regulator